MFKDVPPEILLSGLGLLFAGMFAMRARTVQAGDSMAADDGAPRPPRDEPPAIPPLAWPVAGMAASLAFTAFVWTEAFQRLMHSDWLWILIIAGVVAYGASEVIRAAATGRTSPIIHGRHGPFDRVTQPRRFWASALWNAALTITMAVAAASSVAAIKENRCVDPKAGALVEATISACDLLLADEKAAPDDRVYWLTARAYARVDRDDDRALADLDRALDLDPADGWAHRLRGYIRLKRRDFDGADADLTKGIAAEPDRADAYFDRAMARASLGKMDDALADASKAIELDPEEGDYRQLRGEFHRALGHRPEAAADLEAAAKLRASAD